jgi:hypothetical protein
VDQEAVRAEAQKHADATVAGDLKTAGSSLTPEAMATAGAVMSKLPRNFSSGEVGKIEAQGDAFSVLISYAGTAKDGSDAAATVESIWEERDGAPKIASMKVV